MSVRFLGSVGVLLVPLAAFGATSLDRQQANIEKKIKAEEASLAKDKRALAALKLKRNPRASKQSKKTAEKATKPVDHWAGSNIQLGLVLNTGNTESTNLSAGLNLNYKNKQWLNEAQLQAQLERSQGVLTKEWYYAADQVKYFFGKEDKSFAYGTVNYTNNYFSPYAYQLIGSAGYGRKLIKTPRFSLSLQGGPGVRFDDVRGEPSTHRSLVFFTQSSVAWKITKTTSLSEQLQYTLGRAYNYLQSVTAVTNKLTGNLSLQVSYTLQYYSKIPDGSTNTKKLDTITNMAIVYNF